MPKPYQIQDVDGMLFRPDALDAVSPWCLGGNGGMDPYSSPYIIPNKNPYSPFPHSLLSTREVLELSVSMLRASALDPTPKL